MTPEDRAFLDELSLRLLKKHLRPNWLVKSVHHRGGVDAENLSDNELLALLEGSYSGDWNEPAFTFSEMLACVAAHPRIQEPLTSEDVVTWAFAVLAAADALAHGASDWELQFNIFLDSFLAVREKLEVDEALWIMRRAFCSGRAGAQVHESGSKTSEG